MEHREFNDTYFYALKIIFFMFNEKFTLFFEFGQTLIFQMFHVSTIHLIPKPPYHLKRLSQ